MKMTTTTMMNKFLDTSSLLQHTVDLEYLLPFTISTITLKELEGIKTSATKDLEIKYNARYILRFLETHSSEYTVWIYNDSMLNPIVEKNLPINNDSKILACALDYEKNVCPDNMIFYTNDLALKHIANLFFGDDSVSSIITTNDYKGYTDISLCDEYMAEFYNHNLDLGLNINEYLILRDKDNNIVDRCCYIGDQQYRSLSFDSFNSNQFGQIKAKDIYQQFVFDSLKNNKITMIRGRAGSGKSLIALGYLFNQLERGKIDKIIIFCNTVATKDAARLGFLPGDKNEKLMDSQIGNMLASKLGSQMEVERLIQEEKLVLVPLADCRGYDTSGMHAGIYVTEAQNLNINLMKLLLQRIGEDSICILEGDDLAQVDSVEYDGLNNGMKRVSKIFRNHNIYGEVYLEKIYRGQIANLAEAL